MGKHLQSALWWPDVSANGRWSFEYLEGKRRIRLAKVISNYITTLKFLGIRNIYKIDSFKANGYSNYSLIDMNPGLIAWPIGWTVI